MADYDAIVIGSGAGGMTTALCLARAGKKVLVLEQHYLPGGWCHTFPLGGFDFSPGVHYIGEVQPGGMMADLFESLEVSETLEFCELNPDGFDHILVGKERFDIPKGKETYARRLKERFPRDAAGIDKFLDVCGGIAAELNAGLDVRGLKEAITLPLRMKTVARYGLTSLKRFLDNTVQDPLLRGIFSMQAGDHGVAPSRVPLAQHAAIISHYYNGGYYPRGGARSIPKAFIKQLRKHGGEIRISSRVAKILVEGGHKPRAIGVKLADGTEIRSEIVISNADPGMTFGKLVDAEHLPPRFLRKLAKTTYSISGLSLFLGVDMDVRAAGLDSGNFWYSPTADIERAYATATNPNPSALNDLDTWFLTVTTLKDPSKRRDGLHAMESFSFVDYDTFKEWAGTDHEHRPAAYEAKKKLLIDKMVGNIETIVPGLREKIVFSELGTPLTNDFYVASHRGNLYGTEKVLSQLGPFGYQLHTPIAGLFQCGASTLGHGVAGAMISGVAAATRILKVPRREILNGKGPSTRIYPSEDPASWVAAMRTKPTSDSTDAGADDDVA